MLMKKIIIVSNDVCAIKQIVNTINIIKILNQSSISIYDITDFKNYVNSPYFNESNTIYFIDIYHIEYDFLELLQVLNKKDKLNKTIILNTNSRLKSLLESQKYIYAYLEKDFDFKTKIFDILIALAKNTSYKLNISNLNTFISINKKEISNVYNWPNKTISVNYKDMRNNLSISINNASDELKTITENSFYIENPYHKNSKRTYYTEEVKQFLVDLYLIHKIDPKTLSYHSNIEITYIKKWASLAKYNRKRNSLRHLFVKIAIGFYSKLFNGRN